VNVRRVVHFALWSAAVFLAATCLPAQEAPPVVPVPAPILSARTVFPANGGMDATSMINFRALGMSDSKPYDSFCAAMQSWGRYQIVSTAADPDLVLELSVTAPMAGCGAALTIQNTVKIYDGKTHFLLWTVTQPVKPTNLKSTWRKNIAAANADLVAQLKTLTVATPAH
jgi:hypothetical protein